MANNTIKITIPFSFKGVEHEPSAIIDLDVLIQGDQTLDSTFQMVANENRIDNYSYEYEVLESSPKIFSEPTGVAKNYLSGNDFDIEGFKQQIVEGDVLEKLQTIATEILSIDNLENNKEIKQALLKAYQAGLATQAK